MRYEVARFSFTADPSQLDGRNVPVLEMQVRNERGGLFPEVGDQVRTLLRFHPETHSWEGTWLIPWNPPLGQYSAEVMLPDPLQATDPVYDGPQAMSYLRKAAHRPVLARAPFEIAGRTPRALPPGFSVITLEPGKSGYRRFHGVYNTSMHWSNVLEWARWMYADAFWHCVGETQIWNRRTEDYPWDRENMRMAKLLSDEAHKQGVAYGGYMITFLVLGDEFQLADYNFTTGYDQHTDTLYKKHFVSFDDPARRKDLLWMMRHLDAMDNVDYIGMDYVRADFGALEFTEDFLADTGLRLPPALANGTPEDREKWLGRIAVTHSDPYVEELWQWWRAHKCSTVVSSILQEANLHKPVWVFSLGWNQGHQHGQDPFMLVDAGVSFNAPMFYEADNEQYVEMLHSWNDYLHTGKASLVLGEPVDAKLLQEREDRGGPEIFYQRNMDALESLGPLAHSLGFFWHDINRCMSGGRSMYSGREWGVAGAASFASLREAAKVLPVHVDFGGAWSEPWGVSFTVTVDNLSNSPIARMAVDGLPVRGIGSYMPATMEFGPLAAHGTLTIPWSATWADGGLESGKPLPDRRMLAARVRLPLSVSHYPAIAFTYVRAHASKAAHPPVDVSDASGINEDNR